VGVPVEAVEEKLLAHHLGAALKTLAEALGDADRGAVVRPDEADDLVFLQNLEGVA
jgi:hypothetical protein